MRRMIGAAAGAIALSLSTIGAAYGWSLFPSEPTVGKLAPKFTAALFDGTKVSLDDYKGQVLVVNIWATWCTPCRRELPLLDAYYRLQQKAGLKVIAVTTEDSVPEWQLKPLAKALSIPLVHRMRGPYGDLDGVPTNYVIDRAGVVRYAKAGAFDLDALNDVLVPLLKEAPPSASAGSVADPPSPARAAQAGEPVAAKSLP